MRISDWSSDVCSSDLVQAFREGLARMLGGYFGAIVISGLAWSAFEQCRPATVTDAGPAGGLALAGACLAFTVHLYTAFAGYMGVAIGLGRLLGIAIPENFNRPELARNFLEFWSRSEEHTSEI